MARKVKHRRKHKRGHRRGRSRRITFKRVGHTNLWRRNPSGILGSAIGALKDGGPGAVGAAALNLWAVEPLMARFGVPRAAQPFVKIAAGLAQAALVDKFLPRWKKHSSAAAIGLMTLAANDLLSRLSGHPLGKLQDVADYYNGLNEIVDVPLGVLETGGVDAIYDNTPYGGNVEVMAH